MKVLMILKYKFTNPIRVSKQQESDDLLLKVESIKNITPESRTFYLPLTIDFVPPKGFTLVYGYHEYIIQHVWFDLNDNILYIRILDGVYGVQKGRTIDEIIKEEFEDFFQNNPFVKEE